MITLSESRLLELAALANAGIARPPKRLRLESYTPDAPRQHGGNVTSLKAFWRRRTAAWWRAVGGRP